MIELSLKGHSQLTMLAAIFLNLILSIGEQYMRLKKKKKTWKATEKRKIEGDRG